MFIKATKQDIDHLCTDAQAAYLHEVLQKEYCEIWMLSDIGYVILNYKPKYRGFIIQGIPEIQDLNVIESQRGQGHGRALIEHCENCARAAGYTQIGIGVGMTRDYGAAQRLYIRLGYVPDGEGLNYDRQTLAHGAMVRFDDDLNLMLIKEL